MVKPQRGEVWLIDLGFAARVRPCLILSIPAEDTDRALVTVIPHTTSRWESPFEVATDTTFLRPGAFNVQGIVTIPYAKSLRKLGDLSTADLSRIEGAVRTWLGL